MLTAVILSSVLMIEGQSSSAKQELPLTPAGVAASIKLLAESFRCRSYDTKDPEFRKELSKELVRLNQASEETARKVGRSLYGQADNLSLGKIILTRLWFCSGTARPHRRAALPAETSPISIQKYLYRKTSKTLKSIRTIRH